jgi:spore maturation protein CgeB
MLTGKRVVMANELWFGSTGAALAHGLRAQGWDVHGVDPRSFFAQQRATVTRVMSRLTRPWNIYAYNAAILEAVAQIKPHAFLTVKGSWLQPETLEQITKRGIVSLNYYPDFHFRHKDLDQSTFPRFDLFLTTKSFQVEYLRNIKGRQRVILLHHGYADLVHFPRSESIGESDYLADVTYVGNYSPFKEKWLQAIAHRLPEVDFCIVGFAWENARDRKLKKSLLGNGLTGDFYARAVQHSRINIALHGGPIKPEGWQDLVSTRTFEIPACKGFMLHIDNEEVRGMFEPGREIDVFASEDKLIEKIAYYLANPELRREMIERAYARCVPAYGYDARAGVISRHITSMIATRGERKAGGDRSETGAPASSSISPAFT